MDNVKSVYSTVKEYLASWPIANYDFADFEHFAPNLLLSMASGFLYAHNAHKRRFGTSSLSTQSAYGAQFFLTDWLSSRSGFTNTILGTACYWIGGLSSPEFRTVFLADQLYIPLWTYPYQLVDTDNTVVKYFYPEFVAAPIYHKRTLTSVAKEDQNQEKCEWIEDHYRPAYIAYYERQKDTDISMSDRKYLEKTRDEDLPQHLGVDPFSGEICGIEDGSLWNRFCYAYTSILYYSSIPSIRDLGYATLDLLETWLLPNNWLSESSEKAMTAKTPVHNEELLSKLDAYSLYQKSGYKKISAPDHAILQKYRIRRVGVEFGSQAPMILVTVPDDAKNLANWDADKIFLAQKLVASKTEICFMQEWASCETHAAILELILAIQKEARDKGITPNIRYYDINPRDEMSADLVQALPLDPQKNVSPICTIGMDNPNAKKEASTGAHLNLPQHKITFKNAVGTAIALVATEFFADVLRVSLDKMWDAGTLAVLLEPKQILHTLMSIPKFCLKVSVAPFRLFLYGLTMTYFWATKKNRSVFEIPSLKVSQTHTNMQIPKSLVYSNNPHAKPALESKSAAESKLAQEASSKKTNATRFASKPYPN